MGFSALKLCYVLLQMIRSTFDRFSFVSRALGRPSKAGHAFDYLEVIEARPGFLKSIHGRKLEFLGRWEEKNWLNVPGPFYGADTDTCGCGPYEAAANILTDESGQEFVYRQPRNLIELRQVLQATWADPFSGYAADGNRHWTEELVRDWWRRKKDLLDYSCSLTSQGSFLSQMIGVWQNYLQSEEIERYLRVYAFFLNARRLPIGGEPLPNL